MKQGMIQLYTGDGKGKTSAAVGSCVRAAGHGWRILFLQFLKSTSTGELEPLQKLGVECIRPSSCEKFVFQMNEEEKAACRKEHASLLEAARQAAESGAYDLVVLDEAAGAVQTGMLHEEGLLSLLKSKAPATEVILTGQGASDKLKKAVDYVSDIQNHKHPYQRGIPAREGIEY